MNDVLSVYVHIPFCLKKCYYCDFASYTDTMLTEEYFSSLIREINQKRRLFSREIDTVYIGGGTPSFVEADYILKIIAALRAVALIKEDCEITIEANPNSLTKDNLKKYTDAGINRISLGVQSFFDDELARIGRSHTAAQAYGAVELMHELDIKNFNIDLMFSLPNQTCESWSKTLKTAGASGAAHLSVYALTLEKGTLMFKMYKEGVYAQDDDLDRKMYHAAKNILGKYGYERYEISNFAKKNYRCMHNVYCWDMQEYIGLGAAAHSYFGKKRFSNPYLLKEYIAVEDYCCFYDNAVIEQESELMGDFVMLALRRNEGIDIDKFHSVFGKEFESVYPHKADKWIEMGLLISKNGMYCLSDKGYDFASMVMRDFI